MMVEPARPAAGSPTPAGLMSPPLDDDRGIIPKNAATTTLVWYGMVCYGMVWCGTVWVELVSHDPMHRQCSTADPGTRHAGANIV